MLDSYEIDGIVYIVYSEIHKDHKMGTMTIILAIVQGMPVFVFAYHIPALLLDFNTCKQTEQDNGPFGMYPILSYEDCPPFDTPLLFIPHH